MKNEDKNKQLTTDSKSAGRRKLLKSVVAGGGAVTVAKMLPDQWARPVVDSVMLPSHATTSMSPFGPFYTVRAAMIEPSVQMAEQGFSEELLEFFTPAAQAQFPSPEIIALTANSSGDSFLCASATNVTTEMLAVLIQNTTPPSFIANGCLFGGQILGGQFLEGAGWEVTVRPPRANVTTVVLMSGGPGCSSGVPGSCGGVLEI